MPSASRADPILFHAAGEAEVPAHDRWLTGPEADRLNAMRFSKRRDDARLGRWTAKHAVARVLERPCTPDGLRAVVIRNAADGAPEAFVDGRPAAVDISMTDRAGWGVCAVAAGIGPLGCDLELVEPRTARFVADYFTPAERAVVAAAPGDHDLLANLIWSAKESALKVLREGLRLDTRSVEVTLAETSTEGWSALSVATEAGATFPGWWRMFGGFVLTLCAPSPTAVPAPLDALSPLDGAEPTHGWMAAPERRPGPGPR